MIQYHHATVEIVKNNDETQQLPGAPKLGHVLVRLSCQ